ncbi:MAG: RnfABCDGE type electron transport complex subunit D [Muribaculaceae bacterium]|nr:RnfABCDGE type electron transport complex subunit D [Muribaculaceae bacterium]
MTPTLTVSASPHIRTSRTVASCMWHVVVALIPAFIFAIYYFGIGAVIVTGSAIAGCVATEYLITRYMLRRPTTIANGSAILTGLLLGMNLPSNLPVWIVLTGSLAAIGIGKMAFGGLGCNIFNPAIFGRVFMLISFPAQMTTWPLPLVNTWEYADATTGATILGSLKMGEIEASGISIWNQFIGQSAGSLGEVTAAALLLGFAYLLIMRIISWHIPVAIIVSAAIMSWLAGADPAVEILSGGLLLGAIFMATDYVTSPMCHRGMLLYGALIGVITIVIRQWGAYPEGISFAILIMNGFTPLINRYIRPRRFGERRAGR